MQLEILITCVFLLVTPVFEASSPSGNTLEEEIRASLNSTTTTSSTRSLSRKRRYLLFPVGSSLQLGAYVLVYDTTFPIIVGQSPFVFGSTAALAWQLPYELVGPLLKLKEKEKLRRVDKPGWKLGKNADDKKENAVWSTHHRKTMHFLPEYMHYFKPVKYGSQVYQNSGAYRQAQKRKYSYRQRINYGNRNNYYSTSSYRKPVTTYVNPFFNEVHRRTRRQLFVKVEKLLSAQRKDGRACLLKAVCEVSQASEVGKGTFIEEIIKAIFRFHPHHTGTEQDVYDSAAMKRHNCTEIYQSCDYSLWDFF